MKTIKDYMIDQFVMTGEETQDEEWILYNDSIIEEVERNQDDHCGE